LTRLAGQPRAGRQPLVVNLGQLWAAPLCARLLGRAGAMVVDVESADRPDGSRLGTPRFYDVLHAGHQRMSLDFSSPNGRAALAELLREADVVLEASRPRALRSLGVPAETILADGRARVWVRITGHGQRHNRIAFGDDAAVTGGLVGWDQDGPVFAGDAIADPLTGLVSAVAAIGCLGRGDAWIVDVAMSEVAAYCVRPAPTSEGPAAAPHHPGR
jgi:crotonobetainyl-CoA:carnitine CoA-transferase CaiB-like acyl-CoA transferase